MAAALGHAARRLGDGALRQTQAAAFSRFSPAVEMQQRRLFPRFIQTERASDLPGKEGALKNIKNKTEELYELILKAEREYGYDLGGSKYKPWSWERSILSSDPVLFAGFLALWFLVGPFIFGVADKSDNNKTQEWRKTQDK